MLLQIGTKAYLDTRSGFVPCIVTNIQGMSGEASTCQIVTARVTASRFGYVKGERKRINALWCPPRDCVKGKEVSKYLVNVD